MGNVSARRQVRGRERGSIAAVLVMVGALLAGIAPAGATVATVAPLPSPGSDASTPGSTLTEHIISGTATAYGRVGAWERDGAWAAEPTTTADYRTRVLVRRPDDPTRFNGTVVVEWLNVSAGFDTQPTFLQTQEELLRGGYAWVGVSAQHGGIDGPAGLQASDPARYDSLHHPGDSYSYDIFSDVARQLRNPVSLDLLGGLRPARILAAGQSQSASRLGTYVNAVHPLVHVFDGFFVQDRTANLAPLFDGDTGVPAAAQTRTDLEQPVMEVQAEGDIVALRSHLARQDDSARFRLWEVAGAAHADEYTLAPVVPPTPTKAGAPCSSRVNSADYHVVLSGAVAALDGWVRGESTPSAAPRIELTDPGAPDPIVRDGFGNAKGGIRLPQLEAPTAVIDGRVNDAPAGAPAVFTSFCRLFGRTIPFPEATLARLYADHASYVTAFRAAADRLVAAGFALPSGMAPIVAEAAASDIGRAGAFVAGAAGDVVAIGAARTYGSLTGTRLARPVVGLASTPSGAGYWLVAADGGVFTFGDASFHGAVAGMRLNRPIVGITSTPSGAGYWLVAADGGVFSFGDARFAGSLGGRPSASPVVAMTATAPGGGYLLVARNGAVTAFGDAVAAGSGTAGVVAVAPTPTGAGYWLAHGNGAVEAFGDATAISAPTPTRSTIGMAPTTSGLGYRLLTSLSSIRDVGDAVTPAGLPRLTGGQRAVGIAAMG